MKEKRIKSAMPIYLGAVVWLICGFILPLYKMTNIVIVFALSAIVYILTSKFFKDKIIMVEEIDKANTGDKNADEIINKGRELLVELDKINLQIEEGSLKKQIGKLKEYSAKIFDFVEKDLTKARNIRTFMDYYLPTTIKLLNNYSEISAENVGENTSKAIDKIENIMETIVEAFKNQLDSLYEDKTMDIVAEVKVMEAILKREGLASSDTDMRKLGE